MKYIECLVCHSIKCKNCQHCGMKLCGTKFSLCSRCYTTDREISEEIKKRQKKFPNSWK